MTLTDLLVPTYRQMLRALSGWLDKAEAQLGGNGTDVLGARLAPDMFRLATRIRFACMQVHEGVARLSGTDLPPAHAMLLDEGRHGGDQPGTMDAAKARVAQTIALLGDVAARALNGAADGPIAHELPNGMMFDLSADQYARDWALPQFYFHLMAAYAILRQEGVELGKADYVAHMFAYLRPGTMPGA